uniref:Uncharacterized protein n=1 Tax=Coccidioides posadasii RMSCC 3488 TaxID=454284 RepID=A0A0J6FIL0_COCPO|nr:hypothetical protein CPAG_05551 [Coccidioides posadasii RMSCC 3488]
MVPLGRWQRLRDGLMINSIWNPQKSPPFPPREGIEGHNSSLAVNIPREIHWRGFVRPLSECLKGLWHVGRQAAIQKPNFQRRGHAKPIETFYISVMPSSEARLKIPCRVRAFKDDRGWNVLPASLKFLSEIKRLLLRPLSADKSISKRPTLALHVSCRFAPIRRLRPDGHFGSLVPWLQGPPCSSGKFRAGITFLVVSEPRGRRSRRANSDLRSDNMPQKSDISSHQFYWLVAALRGTVLSTTFNGMSEEFKRKGFGNLRRNAPPNVGTTGASPVTPLTIIAIIIIIS